MDSEHVVDLKTMNICRSIINHLCFQLVTCLYTLPLNTCDVITLMFKDEGVSLETLGHTSPLLLSLRKVYGSLWQSLPLHQSE